jgi:hypothetical protein
VAPDKSDDEIGKDQIHRLESEVNRPKILIVSITAIVASVARSPPIGAARDHQFLGHSLTQARPKVGLTQNGVASFETKGKHGSMV